MSELLMVHEWVSTAGVREQLEVGVRDHVLVVRVAGDEALLPLVVLERVMQRYGKPLDPGVPLEGPSVDFGGAGVLRRIRHRGFYDVIARDFVVWAAPGREPLAELATSVSAALAHFVEAARRASVSSE